MQYLYGCFVIVVALLIAWDSRAASMFERCYIESVHSAIAVTSTVYHNVRKKFIVQFL